MGKLRLKKYSYFLLIAVMILLASCAPAGQSDDVGSVYISVECTNAGAIDGAPEDGWILEQTQVEIEKGDTVWDVLSRVCRKSGIAVAKQGGANGIFITGIGGITAVNAKSGWMFSVNSEFPTTGAGTYVVSSDDVVVWSYTMDSGNDLEP